jgi:hypothetical protein
MANDPGAGTTPPPTSAMPADCGVRPAERGGASPIAKPRPEPRPTGVERAAGDGVANTVRAAGVVMSATGAGTAGCGAGTLGLGSSLSLPLLLLSLASELLLLLLSLSTALLSDDSLRSTATPGAVTLLFASASLSLSLLSLDSTLDSRFCLCLRRE